MSSPACQKIFLQYFEKELEINNNPYAFLLYALSLHYNFVYYEKNPKIEAIANENSLRIGFVLAGSPPALIKTEADKSVQRSLACIMIVVNLGNNEVLRDEIRIIKLIMMLESSVFLHSGLALLQLETTLNRLISSLKKSAFWKAWLDHKLEKNYQLDEEKETSPENLLKLVVTDPVVLALS
jgi:hypothetical protein